ncbi:TetR/AcrR family transcriptional regulator [Cytobacillus sp. Hm23]
MKKGTKTKLMILQKSSNLFNQKGYMTATINDIMTETGLKKGGIYRHFSDKNSLMIEAFLFSANILKKHYEDKISIKTNGKEKLAAFIEGFIELINNEPLAGGCPIINASIEMDNLDNDDMLSHIQDSMKYLIQLLSEIIAKGQENGEFSTEVDAELNAVFILSSLEGALAMSKLFKDQSYVRNVANRIIDSHLI